MRNLILLFFTSISLFGAQEGFKISGYPNRPKLADTDLFITANPGVTNNNISYGQLSYQIGTNTLASVTSGINTIGFSFNTISDMQRFNPATNCIISTKGRLLITDQAGGVFSFDKSSIVPTNAGTIFALPYGSNSGRATRIYENQINIRWFGATEGIDCRNAVQATFNEANRVSATVIGPSGDFIICAGMPIYWGEHNYNSQGAKFWVSNPFNYNNPNNAPTTETYIVSNQLDRNGNYVSWTNSAPNYSWNGKTEIFTEIANSTITGLWLDGGWGTTDGPTQLNPITGISNTSDEMTYYQLFNNTINSIYQGCTFRNIPGAAIEVGHDFKVVNCFGYDYGDHFVYVGQTSDGSESQKNIQCIGNTIATTRTNISVVGNASFVYASFRDAFKFRGNSGIIISNNRIYDTNSLTTGMHLEVNDAQPGDMKDLTITGNILKCDIGIDCVGFRGNGGFGTNDYRIRRGLISNNVFDTTGACFRFRASCNDFDIHHNIFTSVSSVATLIAHPLWSNAINRMTFHHNICSSPAPIQNWISGDVIDSEVSDNWFINTGTPATTSYHVFFKLNPFDVGNIPQLTQASHFTRLRFENNKIINFFSLMEVIDVLAYSGTTTYNYGIANGVEAYSVVLQGGVLYKNTNTTLATVPPGIGWTTYLQPTNDITFSRNYRTCNSTNLSGINSAYVTYFTGSPSTMDAVYTVKQFLNENINNLGDPVSYALGNISDTVADLSSHLHKWNTEILDSLTTTGAFTGFNYWKALNDVEIHLGGAGDQISLFSGETNRFLDIGHSGSGIQEFRIFTNNTIALTLAEDGHIYFGDRTDVFDYRDFGNPAGIISAPVGSTLRNKSGAIGSALYLKETGTGVNGWYPVVTTGKVLPITNIFSPTGTGFVIASNSSWVTVAAPLGLGLTNRNGIISNNIVAGSNIAIAGGANGQLTISSMNTNSGTVSSVAMSVPAFLTVAGSPITTSGTLALNYSGLALPIANGGTAGTTPVTARTALGLNTGFGITNNGNLYSNNIVAGPNIIITNGANGQLTISSSGGTNVPSGSGVVTVTGGVFDNPASPIQSDLNGNPGSGGFLRNILPNINAAMYINQSGGGLGTDGAYLGFDMSFANEFTLNNQSGGGFKWFTLGGSIMNLSSIGDAQFVHISGELSGTPTVLRGPGAGGFGASVSIGVNSSDTAMDITLTTGTAPLANDVLFTVTFSQAFNSAPKIVFSPSNSAAARDFAVQGYPTSSPASFTYNSTSSAMTAGLTYTWTFHVIR